MRRECEYRLNFEDTETKTGHLLGFFDRDDGTYGIVEDTFGCLEEVPISFIKIVKQFRIYNAKNPDLIMVYDNKTYDYKLVKESGLDIKSEIGLSGARMKVLFGANEVRSMMDREIIDFQSYLLIEIPNV
ncbi:hypothetical protein [Peptoniphilus sp. HCN-40583]|uniref:hypothetical protein n=1 Tax=Peptoniphilus sp. HCN-40583 TaxID=3134662 RepID=UPI0030BD0F8A